MPDPSTLYLWMAVVGLVMAILWATRFRAEPLRAKIMVPAFLILSLICLGMRGKWPAPAMILLAVVGTSLLLADVATRSAVFRGGKK